MWPLRPKKPPPRQELTGSEGVFSIIIYLSELAVMAGLSAASRFLETGGELFGFVNQLGQLVIVLVTAPGPKAIHRPASFQQDFECFCRLRRILYETHGIEPYGSWHKHLTADLDCPSLGDINQVKTIGRKNNNWLWCSLIATQWEPDTSSHTRATPPQCHIALHPYMFPYPASGQCAPASIRVLEGTSPIRTALLARSQVAPEDIGQQFVAFPLERIHCDRLVMGSHMNFDTLSEQLRALPPGIQEGLDVRNEQNMIIVAFPISAECKAYVAVGNTPPHLVRAVYVQRPGNAPCVDVTDRIVTENCPLQVTDVCAKLLSSPVADVAKKGHGHNRCASPRRRSRKRHGKKRPRPKRPHHSGSRRPPGKASSNRRRKTSGENQGPNGRRNRKQG